MVRAGDGVDAGEHLAVGSHKSAFSWEIDLISKADDCIFQESRTKNLMRRAFLVLMMTSAAALAEVTPAQLSEQYYRQGLAAEKAGDPVKALKAFENALKVNPQNANARYRLGQVRLNSGTIAAKGREMKFGAVMVPKIELDGATLRETLDFLTLVIERESDGAVAPNFIIQDRTGKLEDAKISLQLKNVPVKAVMEYVTAQAGAKVRFDEHAEVLTPR
jgi:tetratricopeptide (TPR) repeat protein